MRTVRADESQCSALMLIADNFRLRLCTGLDAARLLRGECSRRFATGVNGRREKEQHRAFPSSCVSAQCPLSAALAASADAFRARWSRRSAEPKEESTRADSGQHESLSDRSVDSLLSPLPCPDRIAAAGSLLDRPQHWSTARTRRSRKRGEWMGAANRRALTATSAQITTTHRKGTTRAVTEAATTRKADTAGSTAADWQSGGIHSTRRSSAAKARQGSASPSCIFSAQSTSCDVRLMCAC